MHRMLWIALLTLAAGCGSPSFLLTPVANTNELREDQLTPGRGLSPSKILIIPLEGTLSNSRSEGLLQPTENPMSLFAQQLAKAETDPSIKSVVLRVNSPGRTRFERNRFRFVLKLISMTKISCGRAPLCLWTDSPPGCADSANHIT